MVRLYHLYFHAKGLFVFSGDYRLAQPERAGFCVETFQEALRRYGLLDIFNTDQGSQFTSAAFTTVLLNAGVKNFDGCPRTVSRQHFHRASVAHRQTRVPLPARPSNGTGIASAVTALACLSQSNWSPKPNYHSTSEDKSHN